MICVPYSIAASRIPGAGKGLFLSRPVNKGKILTAPTEIDKTYPLDQIAADPNEHATDSSVRWFEDHCTLSPDWPDECYINHSFKPSGLWHLGFIFAVADLPADTELTIDYGHIIAPDVVLPWPDSETGKPIMGYAWQDSLRNTTSTLLKLVS
jgi:hypothetical protein